MEGGRKLKTIPSYCTSGISSDLFSARLIYNYSEESVHQFERKRAMGVWGLAPMKKPFGPRVESILKPHGSLSAEI